MALVFLLIVAGVVLAINAASLHTSNGAWSTAGASLGLHHTAATMRTKPSLEGSVRGLPVRVEVLVRQGGGARSTMTVYSVVHRAPAPSVVFRRQHAASFLRRIVGGRDVVVGDPRFDDSIVVDAGDDAAITAYLTPARRAAILSVFSTWRTVELTDTALTVSVPGRARDAAAIVSTVNRLVDVCRVLADHEALDAALEPREEGELRVTAEALHELNAGSEPNVVTQMLEAETLVATGDAAGAVEIVEQVAEALPQDPDVEHLRDFLGAAAADPEPPERADLSQQAVIDDLFDESRYGVAIDAHYAEAYADRPIEWTGTVIGSRGYRSDADFGTTPGTRCTVDIGSVGSSRLMSNRVRAVVSLPEGSDVERNAPVTFRGTLLHVDRFTRTFLVRDGALVAAPDGAKTPKSQAGGEPET